MTELAHKLGNELVKVYAGPSKVEFAIHKKLLCDRVKFFERAFCGNFKEATDGIMYLPEDTPESFAMFVDWLYKSKLPVLKDLNHLGSKVIIHLYQLYIFAERVLEEDLANDIMDRILDVWPFVPTVTTDENLAQDISIIFENTRLNSPLRKFCIRDMIYHLCWRSKSSPRLIEKECWGLLWECSRDSSEVFTEMMFYIQEACLEHYQSEPGHRRYSYAEYHYHSEGRSANCGSCRRKSMKDEERKLRRVKPMEPLNHF